MPNSVTRLAVAASLVLAACGADTRTATTTVTDATPTTPTTTTSTPMVVSANGIVTSQVGARVQYDASKDGAAFSDPAMRGLRYTVSFSPSANGLSATGCILTGTLASAGVTAVTIVATDALGRSTTDRFSIIAFAPGLTSPVLPALTDRYADATAPLPAHFSAQGAGGTVIATDNSAANPATDAGATLGRVLFYDTRLSANDKHACASCHLQSLAFGDTAKLSRGFDGGLTKRHSMALANARFYQRGRFFWDERAATLETQVLQPIQDSVEMGMTLDALTVKLGATAYYKPLFTTAFGTAEITSDRIARALAQYVRALVSSGSKYDRAFAGGGAPNFNGTFTAQENQGEQLFRSLGCARCHATNAQLSDDIHNTGLDATVTDVGAGNGRFKAPSLRNVAVRPRYMHDGRFTSLAQVVDFYDAGVQPNPNLDNRLRGVNGAPLRLNLSQTDKSALIAFMGTLTDSVMLVATKFSNPFPR